MKRVPTITKSQTESHTLYVRHTAQTTVQKAAIHELYKHAGGRRVRHPHVEPRPRTGRPTRASRLVAERKRCSPAVAFSAKWDASQASVFELRDEQRRLASAMGLTLSTGKGSPSMAGEQVMTVDHGPAAEQK